MDERSGWQRGLRELTAIVLTLGLVIGGAAAALRALDAVADSLRGEPRGVKRYRSVEEVEKKVRAQLWLPGYFPDSLQWPPAAITLSGGSSPTVALSFVGRKGDGPRLVISQTIGGGRPVPPGHPPPGQVLHTAVVRLNGSEGRLSRIVGEDEEIWHEVAWEQDGRLLVVRFRGPVEDLLWMARSMRRARP